MYKNVLWNWQEAAKRMVKEGGSPLSNSSNQEKWAYFMTTLSLKGQCALCLDDSMGYKHA
jgi:hypothetical protein